MASSGLDVDAFRDHLKTVYGCDFLGEEIKPPYCDGVMPSFFTKPDGTYFSVPSPDENDIYPVWLIDRVIRHNKLAPIEQKKAIPISK